MKIEKAKLILVSSQEKIQGVIRIFWFKVRMEVFSNKSSIRASHNNKNKEKVTAPNSNNSKWNCKSNLLKFKWKDKVDRSLLEEYITNWIWAI